MTQSEMQRRIAEDGWCVIDAVIPPEAVAQVRDSILATVAAHKLPDPAVSSTRCRGWSTSINPLSPIWRSRGCWACAKRFWASTCAFRTPLVW